MNFRGAILTCWEHPPHFLVFFNFFVDLHSVIIPVIHPRFQSSIYQPVPLNHVLSQAWQGKESNNGAICFGLHPITPVSPSNGALGPMQSQSAFWVLLR